jgi:hypothetical protein
VPGSIAKCGNVAVAADGLTFDRTGKSNQGCLTIGKGRQLGKMMARYSVDIIGKRLQHLGTVVASDERKALEEAIRQFAIRPALRSKVAVTKIADND